MATLRSDLGDLPWENHRLSEARQRIFAADPAHVRQLLADAELCDLNEWATAFVADLRTWIAAGQTISPKQLRTLEDIVARGR